MKHFLARQLQLPKLSPWFCVLLLSQPVQAQTEDTDPQRIQALVGEFLNAVDWQLMLRIKDDLLRNLDLLVPYAQEYVSCLEAEGALEKGAPLNLEGLIAGARNASAECQVILESLAGQMDFDLSEEELREGLNPKYQELLDKSL